MNPVFHFFVHDQRISIFMCFVIDVSVYIVRISMLVCFVIFAIDVLMFQCLQSHEAHIIVFSFQHSFRVHSGFPHWLPFLPDDWMRLWCLECGYDDLPHWLIVSGIHQQSSLFSYNLSIESSSNIFFKYTFNNGTSWLEGYIAIRRWTCACWRREYVWIQTWFLRKIAIKVHSTIVSLFNGFLGIFSTSGRFDDFAGTTPSPVAC